MPSSQHYIRTAALLQQQEDALATQQASCPHTAVTQRIDALLQQRDEAILIQQMLMQETEQALARLTQRIDDLQARQAAQLWRLDAMRTSPHVGTLWRCAARLWDWWQGWRRRE